MTTTKRKSVEKEQVGKNRWGPIYVLRITYTDGRVSYGASFPGGSALFGPTGEQDAREYAKHAEEF